MTERFNTILEELPQFMEENVEEKKFQLENDEIHNLEQYFKKEKMKLFVSEVKWGRDSEVAEVTIMKRHNWLKNKNELLIGSSFYFFTILCWLLNQNDL